jgi:hypothetical protein
MTILQWIVAAITSIFVATVGYLQWRTAHQKAVLDLFDKRFKIYETVKRCVDQVIINPNRFDGELEKEFLKAVNEAYFFFGDDVNSYLDTLRKDILVVRDPLPKISLAEVLPRITNFYKDGLPLFAKYMRFSQTVQGWDWLVLRWLTPPVWLKKISQNLRRPIP